MTDQPSPNSPPTDRSATASATDAGDARADPTFPRCPVCETSVAIVTSRGPTDHLASPCGHRVNPATLERPRAPEAGPGREYRFDGVE